jgi:hypothetical protein
MVSMTGSISVIQHGGALLSSNGGEVEDIVHYRVLAVWGNESGMH